MLIYYFNNAISTNKHKFINIIEKYDLNEILFQTALNSQEFVFNANYGSLTQTIPSSINNNPYLSIVIPIFNCENFIQRAVLSIQNQNFTNSEIIMINDYSTDNSYKIIKKLSETDKRIKIINNTKNMGQFYSRCVGTLVSRGKYILPLDSDDMYLTQDTFYYVYNELKKNKPDFLKFRGILTSNLNDFFKKKNLKLFRSYISNNKIFYQPNISNMGYKQCSLQATCILNNLYRKIIDIYGKIHFYDHITYYEDCIINYIIYQYSKSFELFLKIGYLYIYRSSSNSHTQSVINKFHAQIYYIEVILVYSNFSIQNKLFAIQDLMKLIDSEYYKNLMDNAGIQKKLKLLAEIIISDKNVSKEMKEMISKRIIIK